MVRAALTHSATDLSPHTGRNGPTHKPQKTISAVSNTLEHKLGPTSSALLLFKELQRTNFYHTDAARSFAHTQLGGASVPRCFWPTCQNSTWAIRRRQSPLRDKAGLHKRPSSSGRERRHYGPGLAAEYRSWREKNGNDEKGNASVILRTWKLCASTWKPADCVVCRCEAMAQLTFSPFLPAAGWRKTGEG